jgi:deoxyadenosine/deoxycytidine kinase
LAILFLFSSYLCVSVETQDTCTLVIITHLDEDEVSVLIGLVGPCGAGKSSLAAALQGEGFSVRHIAQEHSYVPDMWKRLTNPDLLIYLDVSYENTIRRRNLDWTYAEYAEQLNRLRHARQYADLVLDTNPLNLDQVRLTVLSFISSHS